MPGRVMASNQNGPSCNEDVRVTGFHYGEQCAENRPIVCSDHVPASSVTVTPVSAVQPERLLLQDRQYLDADEESFVHIATSESDQPLRLLTVRSREEIQLLAKLREQRLQHRICEESLKHLVIVKELEKKLQAPCETPKPPSPLPPNVQPPDAAAVNATSTSSDLEGDVTMNNNSSFSNSTKADHEFPPSPELTKKLQSQRIQYQIEIEEAVHKIKMKGLAKTETLTT